jgi:hypothetical protein
VEVGRQTSAAVVHDILARTMRKPYLLTAFLLLAVLTGSSQTVHHIKNGFVTAQEYLDLDAKRQNGYAMGIIDGMLLSPLFGAPDDGEKLKLLGTCVQGMNDDQMRAIFDKFLKDHPERWNDVMHAVAFTAVMEACEKKLR